jgi:hypothetical protein
MKRFNFIGVIAFCCMVSFAFINCKKKSKADCPNIPSFQTLTSSAKEWFPYTSNRILIFENSILQRDTLELKNFFTGEGEVWNGDECPITKGEFLRGNIIDKKSADTIKVQIGNTEQVILQKRLGYLYYFDTKKYLAEESTTRRFEPTITLNNKTYTSVLVYECSSVDNCSSSGLTKFYFSKTKGLVAYQRNNVLWTLR